MLKRALPLFFMSLVTVSGLWAVQAIPEDSLTGPRAYQSATLTVTARPKGDGVTKASRSADGLFHVPVTLDGHKLRMIVDTGASRTFISRSSMSGTGPVNWIEAPPRQINTLNGTAQYRLALIKELRIGNRIIENMEIGVIDDAQRISVVGQDLLRHMESITIRDDKMTLE